MLSNQLIKHTAEVVKKDFFFDELDVLLSANELNAINELKHQLALRIAHMIDHDFELLMQIFYRIDLNENKVKQALNIADNPSAKLAELVLEREMQKARTRMEYASRNKQ